MTSSAVARAGLTVTGAFFLSRLLGWVRVVVLAQLFGSDAQIADFDAYNAAFRIPDLIYQLVAAGAVASALVPILSGLLAHDERARAWRVASIVSNLVLVALIIAAAAMFLLAPQIVPLLVSGFDAEKTAKTVELTRIMLLAPIFLALGAIASAVLNAEHRFGAAALAPLAYNLAIIVVAIALAPVIGIDAAALGVVVGGVLHLAVQLPALRRRFTWSPTLRLTDPAAREAFSLMVPRAIGLGGSQITFIVNTALASSIVLAGMPTGSGAVSVYVLAFSVLQIPLGIVAVPIGVVLLPLLSRSMALGEQGRFANVVGQSLRLLLWMTIFLAFVGIVLRDQSVELLFGFGQGLSQPALDATAATVGVFLLGLPAHALNVILARAFYSDRDTRTPVAVALASVAVNIAVSLATVEALGLLGLALGIALGGWFESLVLIVLLRRRVGAFGVRPLLGSGLFVGGALIAAGIAWVVAAGVARVTSGLHSYLDAALQVGLGGLAAAAGYLLYSRAVRIPELARSVGLVRSALRRG